jgi:hypothetical protein
LFPGATNVLRAVQEQVGDCDLPRSNSRKSAMEQRMFCAYMKPDAIGALDRRDDGIHRFFPMRESHFPMGI